MGEPPLVPHPRGPAPVRSLRNPSEPVTRFPAPDAPAARFWGSEPRASGIVGAFAVVLVLFLIAACRAAPAGSSPPGTSPAVTSIPSVVATASPPASTPPAVSISPQASPRSVPATPSPPAPSASSPAPSTSPGAGAITSAEQAIAAVAVQYPEFTGFTFESAVGEPVIGASRTVRALQADDGWQLLFAEGSGDCPAGCIDFAFTKFSVSRSGAVALLCSWSESAGELAEGERC